MLIVLAGFLSSCSKDIYMFTSFHEPADEGLRLLYSDDAYHWNDLKQVFLKPTVGTEKVMRDPSIVRGPDGLFHLVWTCSWKGDKGFGYAESKDLINWSEQRFIPVMEHEPTAVNVWAPELFYDDETKQYVIIWATTIPYRFEKGEEEEKNNHRIYYTTTTDFKSFSKAQLFLDPGFSVIDAVIVKREPKDYVLVLKDNTRPNRNLKVAFAEQAIGPYHDVSESFSGMKTEGPTVVKAATDYLIYFDSYGDKKYKAIATKDFKEFKAIDEKVSIPEGHKHGTIFKASRDVLKGLKDLVNHD
ncbi:Glycosyl hydrolases family 32 N-terminal domain-containing protein [Olivibacter domesticus]|uniref:Glycosyl hydrolases family 32 N-terminal domain-containing protein n=2 Tax=Olivibacter domesticus TaxID=407022 RepID=A0A1H7U062_OLID1|nr:Glycosyl hydrolases family 32 N-terminal domain-containing protein [Olivibacter domesticus]